MMDLHEAPLLEKSAQAEENTTTENVSLPETAKKINWLKINYREKK